MAALMVKRHCMVSCGTPWCCPVTKGRRSTPSRSCFCVTVPPAAATKVGRRSRDHTGLSYTEPPFNTPGHVMTNGTRMPPSSRMPFWPFNGALIEPFESTGPPLSLINTTRVRCDMPAASTAPRMAPMLTSRRCTMAQYARRFFSSTPAYSFKSSSSACMGACGALKETYRKNGSSVWRFTKSTASLPISSVM